ncbi:MAG: PA14 domain-containing protein [Bacteroidota bacterium]
MYTFRLTIVLVFMLAFIDTHATDPPFKTVTLCSGKTFTWEEYLAYKAKMSKDWDEEIEFVGYEVAALNNSAGAWSTVINLPLISAAGANLPDGKVMLWSARDKFSFGGNQGKTWTAIFDPATNTATEALIENTSHDMFCPGVNTLPDGRVMVTGGSSSNKTSIYNPTTNAWSAAETMNIARGYHSNVTLPSGATFTIGGSWSGGTGGKNGEIWTSKSGWYQPQGIPVDVITDGTVSNQNPKLDDYFPWLWVAPNGKLFHAGPSQTMHWIDHEGVGNYTSAGERDNDPYSASGTTVMYDVGKILKVGGAPTSGQGGDANGKTYTIDINDNTPVVTPHEDLEFSRNVHNSVVLPSGEVLVIGGIPLGNFFSDTNSRLNAELWNPSTGQWTTMAAMTVPRNYHSIALLLADGRVLTSGGGLCGSCPENHPDAQIFSPPYLFNANGTLANRPVINNTPTSADYNTTIQVKTNATIGTFALVRNSGATHSTNNDQRRIPLTFTNQGNNNYQLDIPDRNILPPGSYMLFAMKNNGVPSVAKFITIGEDVHATTTIADPNLGGTGLTGTYFNNKNLTDQVLEQLDANINFNWGTGAPVSGVGANDFSVRWEGGIEVPRSGGYTFYTNSDDGVRLWVDDKLIVDNWTNHAPTEDIGTIVLEPSIRYTIKLEYFENTGGAVAQLRWSGPGINKKIIPTNYLFPPDPCTGNNFNIVCEKNINNGGWVQDGDCIVRVCPGDIVQLSVNPNGFPTSWTGPNGVSGNGNDLLVSNNVNANFYGDYVATINVNGCTQSETITLQQRNNCNPCTSAGGDSDGDGICDDDDCAPNDAFYPALPNDPCDDGNSNTTGDQVTADGCDCEGTPVSSGCNVVASSDGCTITISGINNDINNIKVFNPNFNGVAWACNPWQGNPCGTTETISNLPNGTYPVSIFTQSNGAIVCNFVEQVVVNCGNTNPCASAGGDTDNDGVCNDDDCAPNNANFPATPGSPCNDGNPDTDNDEVTADGCGCAGTPPNNGGGGGTSGGCDVVATTDGCNITITGINDAVSNIKLFNPNFAGTAWSCNPWQGSSCSETEVITGLSDGVYPLRVLTNDSNGAAICDLSINITISCSGGGGGVGDPCAGAGGDADGDGICGDDDNCPDDFNPGQADSDGDGIGNVCDTTAPPGGCSNITNLALNQPTAQSSTITAAGITGSSSKAVDGNTNGAFFTSPSTSSVSATTNESQAWWEVDLGDIYDIEQIKIYNRTDGSDKTKSCYILVSSTPFSGNNLAAARNQANAEAYEPNAPNAPSTYNFNTEGRYIRIQHDVQGYLVLAEVEVMGCIPSSNFAVPNLLNFRVEKNGIQSEIEWLMLDDVLVDFYEVERSLDGIHFELLGEISAYQTSVPRHYQLTDSNPEYGENFYRLKLIYNDGSFNYSSIRRLEFDIDFEKVVVFPNPTNHLINVTLVDFSGKEGTVEIYNALGQRQLIRSYVSIPSVPVQVNVDKYVPGIYTISIKVENYRRIVRQFVVTDR